MCNNIIKSNLIFHFLFFQSELGYGNQWRPFSGDDNNRFYIVPRLANVLNSM